MKIAVIGTHGVGKSTLVSEFISRRPEYSVIPEMAREMIAEQQGDIGSWFDFQIELLWRKTRSENTHKTGKNVISDRTAVDNWAYCTYYRALPEKLLYVLKEFSIAYSNDYYDLFVYLPAEDFVAAKSRDEEKASDIDRIIGTLLPSLNNLMTLRGNLEERVEKLVSACTA
ncbi:MAG: ATP-binding protein [Actinobacteria bacterium]|nr:ATP-binding protein [Actinomycetota bacterium]